MQLALYRYTPGTGWSAPLDPELDSQRTLVLAFGAPDLSQDQAPLAQLAATFPRSHLAGCSSAGEVLDAALDDGTLSVAVLRFAGAGLRLVLRTLEGPHASRAVGMELARGLLAPDLRWVFVLSDGLGVNGSGLVAGIAEVLPPGIPVTGGLAGDGSRFERTWVLDGARPRSGAVSALGLYGEGLRIGHGSRGGWGIFGPERRVTRSAGNVLYELDGRPALEIYREYLGELAAGLPAAGLRFPLALRASPDDPKQLVRTILAVDPQAQSLTFAGDVPQGHLARLMRASGEELIAGAEEAARLACTRGEGTLPVLSIAVSCVGRRMVLGERTEEELEATLAMLPPGSRQIGFYSYGELSPYAEGVCDLHNQTMTLTTVAEVAPG